MKSRGPWRVLFVCVYVSVHEVTDRRIWELAAGWIALRPLSEGICIIQMLNFPVTDIHLDQPEQGAGDAHWYCLCLQVCKVLCKYIISQDINTSSTKHWGYTPN